MILDRIDNAIRYAGVHGGVARGLEWLATHEVKHLPEGKHPIDGDSLYLMVVKGQGKGQSGTKLETHRRYIDIQYTVADSDTIGWRNAPACAGGAGYDATRDIEFYSDTPASWITVPAGHFAVFFPEDAHAPMGTTGQVNKVVVKVAV